MELWCWLLSNKDSVRLIAYLIFGLTSFLFACVALWVAYRNNFGWRPLILLLSYGIGGGGSRGRSMTCTYEIWNRRKYPVVLREMQVSWGATRIKGEEGFTFDEWRATSAGNMLYRFETGEVLKANDRTRYDVWGPLTEDQNGSIGGAGAPPIEVWAHVFDPKSDRHYVVRAKSRMHSKLRMKLEKLSFQRMPPYK